MIGDCDWCGHSIAYHVPLVGCIKCSCDEFVIRNSHTVSLIVLGMVFLNENL